VAAATAADTGNVKTQVQMIFPATPQRTAVSRLVAPTPTIAPAIVWVVLTGIPHTHHGMMGLQHSGRDNHCDGVCRIMKTVDELEYNGDKNNGDDKSQRKTIHISKSSPR